MVDIILIVVGLVIVAASFFISEKIEGNKAGSEGSTASEVWSAKDEKYIRKQIKDALAKELDASVIKADDQLSEVSNEKIMAVSDFSDQILEKIEQNHTEVVFLYNMLNEKETEMKTLMAKADKAKSGLENVMATLPIKANAKDGVAHARKSATTVAEPAKNVQTAVDILSARRNKSIMEKEQKEAEVLQKERKERVSDINPLNHSNEKNPIEEENEALHQIAHSALEMMQTMSKEEEERTAGAVVGTSNESKNQKILRLHQEGKSIIEISKELGLGQGEVRLVINLFDTDK